MGLQNLHIIFDNPLSIYYSGQTVSGQLLVEVDTPKILRNIVIKLKGEALVHWTGTYMQQGTTRTVTFISQEIYFENKILVFSKCHDTETLPAGEHTFPFSLMLPNNLPSSFEFQNSYIRYTVKATLDRPWKFNHEVKAAFTVLSHEDLNMDPRNREPMKLENCKTFCCCCCKSGPLTLISTIPARGFVPGQRVPVTVEVDNASNVKINSIEGALQKSISLHAVQPKKTIQHNVNVCTFTVEETVDKKDSRTWTLHFTIPPLPPSQLRNCSIIDLEYKIKIMAKPDGVHLGLVNEIPINIGTIPLIQDMTRFAPVSGSPFPLLMHMSSQNASLSNAEGTTSRAQHPNIREHSSSAPPSYEESMFGTNSIGDAEDGKYVFGITSYNPRYPTYSFPDPPPDSLVLGQAASLPTDQRFKK